MNTTSGSLTRGSENQEFEFQPLVIFQGLEGTEKGGIMSYKKVSTKMGQGAPGISHFGDIRNDLSLGMTFIS